MPKKFPYLEVSGSHRTIGEAIGSTFQKQIQYRISYLKHLLKHYDKYVNLIKLYYTCALQRFPHLLEELESTAHAAQVKVEDYFFLNCSEIYHRAKPSYSNYFFNNDHCTIAVSFNNHGTIVGHNEDWILEEQSDLYVLKATINGTTFLGLQYCTELAGVSASLNNWGLIQCINDLNPVIQIGVPKNFVARAVLQCKTLDEAQAIIEKTKRASGFNHVLVQNNTIRNIEVASNHIAIDELIQEPYVHTNHYLSEQIKQYERFHHENSEHRLQNAQKLMKPHMTDSEMIHVLGAAEQHHVAGKESSETIASILIVPQQKELYICYGKPKHGEFAKYTL